jgi:hypothetical protein
MIGIHFRYSSIVATSGIAAPPADPGELDLAAAVPGLPHTRAHALPQASSPETTGKPYINGS